MEEDDTEITAEYVEMVPSADLSGVDEARLLKAGWSERFIKSLKDDEPLTQST